MCCRFVWSISIDLENFLNKKNDVRRYFRIIIALFIPPLGVFIQVGIGRAFWINLLIYLFAVGVFGFPVLFGMWTAAMIHTLFIILMRK